MGSMDYEVSEHSPIQSWSTFDVALAREDDEEM